jgi:hypothetical protein
MRNYHDLPTVADPGGTPELSNDKDHHIAGMGYNGMTHEPVDSGFTTQQKAETGLISKEPI